MLRVMDDETPEARLARVTSLLASGGRVNEVYVAEHVEAAAERGSGAAAAFAAVLAGAGFGRAKDWGAALDWLGVAAERGATAAQQQLRFLSKRGDGDWRSLAAQVDVAGWTTAREARLVVEAPQIGVAEDFIDPALCAWLIERARPHMAHARVYDYLTGKPLQHDLRTNREASFSILELDVPMLLLRERIAATMHTSTEMLERTSVFNYQVGQTFARHADYLDPSSAQLAAEIAQRGQRVATFLIYLNQEFEGGETRFFSLDLKLRLPPGGALFFRNVLADGAPDTRTEHEGAPPSAGEKWLLSQFIRDRPQSPG